MAASQGEPSPLLFLETGELKIAARVYSSPLLHVERLQQSLTSAKSWSEAVLLLLDGMSLPYSHQ